MKKFTPEQKQSLTEFLKTAEQADEVLRAQAILMLDAEIPFEQVTLLTRFSRTHAFRLRREYFKKGISILTDKHKGKPKELLTKQEREEILETVKTKTPKDFGYTAEYWTTGFLGKWIEEKYEVRYKSKTSLYLVFRHAKFTYHKPGRVYDKHDDREVLQWKTALLNNPRIKRYWNKKDTVILCADEMILTTDELVRYFNGTRFGYSLLGVGAVL